METKSDTPETDALEYYFANHDSCAGESIVRVSDEKDVTWDKDFEGLAVPSTFARKMERERNQYKTAAEMLAESIVSSGHFTDAECTFLITESEVFNHAG